MTTEPAPDAPRRPGTRRGVALTFALVVLAVVQAAYAAWHQDWTYDEPFHLGWSERLLDSGVTERESRERFNTKTPASLPGAALRRLVQRRAPERPRLARFAARLPGVATLFLLLAAIFLTTRRLFGPTAACLATAAAALDPNLVAHGSLATVDAAHAFATLVVLAAGVAFARSPSPARAALLGLTVGLAFATKFSAFLLLPSVAALPLLFRARGGAWPRWVLGALLATVAAVLFLCAAYLFIDVGTPLAQLPLRSRPLSALARTLPWLALPLPSAFWTGLDLSLAFERPDWNVLILGRRYPQGVWFYFALLWLLKTPLLLLAATGLGLVAAIRSRELRARSEVRLLALTLLVHLGYFSLLFHAQIGYRFVLMCLPIAYVLAATGLTPCVGRPAARIAILVVVSTALVESLPYLGNPLSFSNSLVWPKQRAFRLFADSNLDWGQNRDKIQNWLAARGAAHTHLDPPHVLAGHNTFGANLLAGVWDYEAHRWLREHAEPAGHFGHTYVWFDVDTPLFERFMDEQRRLPALGSGPCSAELSYATLPAGTQVPFSQPGTPGSRKEWVVCVQVRKPMDFGLRGEAGRLAFGPVREGGCAQETVDARQVVWWRLEPGLHAFCAAEVPNRRTWLPHAFEGLWLFRGRSVGFHIRESR